MYFDYFIVCLFAVQPCDKAQNIQKLLAILFF